MRINRAGSSEIPNSVTVLDSEGAVSGFTMSAPMIQAMATALMHAGLCLFLFIFSTYPAISYCSSFAHDILSFWNAASLFVLLTPSQFPSLSLYWPFTEAFSDHLIESVTSAPYSVIYLYSVLYFLLAEC